MNIKALISKRALHETLCREFELLKSPGCAACKPGMPRRLGSGYDWTCQLPPCAMGCHRELDFLSRLFSQQYRLRDLSDTLG